MLRPYKNPSLLAAFQTFRQGSKRMDTIESTLFFTGIAWLMTHELDAVQQHEWRFFPFLRPFSDVTAYRIFSALHIPLFAFILWNVEAQWFWIGFDIFLIFHAGLHWLLRNHPKIEFRNWFSKLLIYGGAIIGAVHLVLLGWG